MLKYLKVRVHKSIYELLLLTRVIQKVVLPLPLKIYRVSVSIKMSEPRKYIAFMCHTELLNYNYLEDTINEYDIGGYVIAHETEPYSHFHFLVEMKEADYIRFRKRVFIDKLKLRGQARNGRPRQYGKVGDIDDFEKMLSYTVKDENIRSNLSDELINEAIDKSFKKQSPKLLKEKMLLYVEEKTSNYGVPRYYAKKKILKLIVEWCFIEKIPVRKSILESYYFYYRQFTKIEKNRLKPEDFLLELYGAYEWERM